MYTTTDYQETRQIDVLAEVLAEDAFGGGRLDAAYMAAGELCNHLRDATEATDDFWLRRHYSNAWTVAIECLSSVRDARQYEREMAKTKGEHLVAS